MSVGLIREDKNGRIDCEIPIAGTKFFMENWDKARKEMGGIRIIQQNGYFKKQQIDDVMKELELYEIWAKQNLSGKDLNYMIERIDDLKRVVPEMFIDDETVLYIY